MLFGVLLLLGAAGLTVRNTEEDRQAGADSQQAAQGLREQIPNYAAPVEPDSWKLSDLAASVSAAPAQAEMQTMEVGGQEYIGVLDIPALGLSLPILLNCDSSLLKLSPCRYTGSFLDDSLILAGHNYRSHFGSIGNLTGGDAVFFTDVTGEVYTYEVTDVETISGSDTEAMASGDWDLTFFTCTLSGTSRIAVRCQRVIDSGRIQ